MSYINEKLNSRNKNVVNRLTPLSFWANFFDSLLKMLPRTNKQIAFLPITKIVVLDLDLASFSSEHEPPTFKLSFTDAKKSYGWFYLEASVARHTGNRLAKLRFDLNNAEQHVLEIPSNLRGTIREVIYIPKNTLEMFWQPSMGIGRFSQPTFILHQITGLESFYRRLWRVLGDYWPNRNQLTNDSDRPTSLWGILFSLNTAYRWSANLRLKKFAKVDYDAFLKTIELQNKLDIRSIDKQIAGFINVPTLSIVMPVYNPPVKFFKEALDSVIAQSYKHWELCIADDASTNPAIKSIIKEYKQKDDRIKVVYRTENGHISAASNSALDIAKGDYIVLMDHDDLIAADALFYVALEINRYPNASLIYSDEDKVNEWGARYAPHFKPDWNEDLFYTQNYISHLGVYKTNIAKEIGGFREGYEGSQDYDFALRFISKTSPDCIRHIPKVLYHWRAHSESTAQNSSAKNYAHDAGLKALNDYFKETDIKAIPANDGVFGLYRIKRPVPSIKPFVSLIIATRDKVELLQKCVSSIQKKTNYTNYEIIIVDNQSIERETLNYFKSFKDDQNVRVVNYNAAFNYSAINNFAAKLANGDILGLINNDIEVINHDWLDEMVSNVIRPDVGVVGAKLLYSDNTIQHAGVILGIGGMAAHAHKFLKDSEFGYFGRANLQQEFSAVTAACMLVRKDVFMKAGQLDDENLTVAFNDVDFCLKVRALGLKVIYTPYAKLYHHESISRGQEDTAEKQKRQASEMAFMRKKWGPLLKEDPFYNPNLTIDTADFSLNNIGCIVSN